MSQIDSSFPTARVVCTSFSRGAGRGHRRALVLLEVVVSLGILVVTMAVIGLVFRNGMRNVETSEKLSRGMIMAERLIAEIDTNSGLLNLDEPEQFDYFKADETLAGMSWKVKVEPLQAVEGLLQIDISIFIGDPEDEDLHENILSTRIYRAIPRGIDLENDFGLDEDQIQQLSDAIPGGSQFIDPNNFDPKALASLDMDTLIGLLPTLIAAFGENFAGGQMDQIIAALQSGDLSALQGLQGQLGGLSNLTGGQGLPSGLPGGLNPGGGQGGDQSGGRPPRGRRDSTLGGGGQGGGNQGGSNQGGSGRGNEDPNKQPKGGNRGGGRG